MAYPYSALAADKTNATTSSTDHPAHHNALAQALNDLRTLLTVDPTAFTAFGRQVGGLADAAALRTLLAVYTAGQTDTAIGTAIANLVASSPATLDTLDELAAALGDDPNFATTVATNIGLKAAKASNLSDLADADAALTNLGLTANGKSLVKAANYAAVKVLLGLVIGTDVQAYSAVLAALVANGTPGTAGLAVLSSSTGAAARAAISTFRHVAGSVNGNLAAAATRFLSPFGGNVSGTTDADASMPLIGGGSLGNLDVRLATNPGSGKSYAFTVFKNGSATAMTGTIADAATSATLSGGPITYADGDTMSIRVVPSGTPTATLVRWIGTLTSV